MDRNKMLQLLQDLEEKRKRYQMGSSPQDVEKQHSKGKLTARERIALLFEPGTFQELNLWALPFRTGYEIDDRFSPADAVAVGYGKVDGRTVMAYAHDFTVLSGTQATVQHAKITKTIETAIKMGVPYIGIFDSAGIRLQDRQGEPGSRPPADGIGLHGTGSYMYSPPLASGIIPQIALLLGPQFAGSAYSPVLKDFVIMRQGPGFMALASPPVIKAATGAEVTNEQIGGAMMHATISGTCDKVVNSDEEGIDFCKKLLSYWPSNWKQQPPLKTLNDSPDREEEELLDIVPFDLDKSYDMHRIIALLVDEGEYLEVKSLYAPSIITCFARMGGHSVGLIANNPEVNLGAFDTNVADKAARFIRFCDAFNIPLVFLTDTIGFVPDKKQTTLGLEKQAAKVIYA
ncbi:MAG: methylmalonyl-CoA carboxyltransferase, partial [Syntrophomonadaceae bacterium]|nr:methylmalonyl-CoA carboxyltransferase [Syntrophomonadaceae bacterium]